MRKVALAQINPTLGDFQGNAKKIIAHTQEAKKRDADLVVFPECALFGYHPFDLLERTSVVQEQERVLESLADKIPQGIGVILGAISFNKKSKGRRYHNSAAFIQSGRKPKYFHKQLLPTEDVFDEGRFIEPGEVKDNFFNYKGRRIFICICEDIWAWDRKGERNLYRSNPLLQLEGEKADLVINLSASPFYLGKQKTREYLVQKTAKLFGAPMIYANLVGAQDEVIYDGGSFVLDSRGRKLLQCSHFQEDFCVLDLENQSVAPVQDEVEECESIRRAIVLGLSDYSRKVGIKKAHLGLSGGVDSALVCALAVDAFGAENVTAIAMPTKFNAAESQSLAREQAANLGIEFIELPIQGIFANFENEVNKHFEVQGFSVVHENLQARIRGALLMAYSNAHNSLLLSTSNKSEMAAGYSTLYGDMNGAMAPIGDLKKGQVYALCRHYNLKKEIIPEYVLTRPPSAELRPDQKDQDSLPPYDVLDKAVEKLVVNAEPASSKVEKWLLKQLMISEFKRWQAPPVIKLTRHAFGRGRRYPIAHQARI